MIAPRGEHHPHRHTLMVQAAQITPNPNPAGSTIDIINDPSQ